MILQLDNLKGVKTSMLKSYLVIRDSGCKLDIPEELTTLQNNKKFIRVWENKIYQSST